MWQGLGNENQRHLKEDSVWAPGQGLGTLPEQLGTLVRHFDANAQLGPVHSLFTPQGIHRVFVLCNTGTHGDHHPPAIYTEH